MQATEGDEQSTERSTRQYSPRGSFDFPVKLELITFHCITKYLRTFSKTVSTKRSCPIEIDEVVVEGEMSDGGSVGDSEQDGEGEQQQTTRVQVRLSKLAYGSARSGLFHMFSECGVDKFSSETSQFLWKNFTQYNKGNARLSAEEREALGLRRVEGKDHMPFKAYEHLCNILLKSPGPEHIARQISWYKWLV